MSITGVLGRGWGSPTDWSGIDPRNNGKDRHDQARGSKMLRFDKRLCRSETKSDGVDVGDSSYAQGLAFWKGVVRFVSEGKAELEICHTFQELAKSWKSCLQAPTSSRVEQS
ncbi:hypothetical protein Tco_1145619 [Tanacetum coccineum]